MGSDFHYTDANMWYVNMDKLIQHVNEAVIWSLNHNSLKYSI